MRPAIDQIQLREVARGLQPRLAFFDIDGTLVNRNGTISDRTVAALQQFSRDGGKNALASGRAYFGARTIIEQIGINAPSVFFSGALVIDPTSNRVLLEKPVGPSTIQWCLEQAQREGYYLELYTVDNYFVGSDSHFCDMHAEYLHRRATVTDLSQCAAQNQILKLVICTDNREAEAAMRLLIRSCPDCSVGISYGAAHPNITFFNISSAAASREAAFNCILADCGLTKEQVLAFGDGESDIPFLTLAQLGIAMANAPQEVRSRAKFVTTSVEDDGVALVMEQLRTLYLPAS